MLVAVTIWDGRVSPVFDVSREALLLSIEDGAVAERRRVDLEAPGAFGRVKRLTELGVETLVCGAISNPLHRELVSRGVVVVSFVAGETDAVVASFLAGDLPTPAFSMPGCRGRRNRHRGGRGQRGGIQGNGAGRRGRP